MRTLKTLAVLTALLLVAGSASANVILTLTSAPAGGANTHLIVTLSFNPDPYAPGVSALGFNLDFGGTGILAEEFTLGTLDHTLGAPPDAASGDGYFYGTTAAGPTTGSAMIARHTVTNWDGNFTIPHTVTDSENDVFYCADNANARCDNAVFGGRNDVTVVPIPEPTTAALLGLGLFGLVVTGRRR